MENELNDTILDNDTIEATEVEENEAIADETIAEFDSPDDVDGIIEEDEVSE